MSEAVPTDFFCPHCARRIELRVGQGEQRVLTAISLQAEHFGTQVVCQHCGNCFVFTRVRESSTRHLGRPHFRVAAQPPQEDGSFDERNRPLTGDRQVPARATRQAEGAD